MKPFALPLLGLLACPGPKDDDTDRNNDTDDGSDTVMMSGLVTVPDGVIFSDSEVTVGLVGIADLGDDGIAFGETLAANPVGTVSADTPWYIVWPDVPEDSFFQIDDETGDEAAIFMLAAWLDDGDGQWSEGEMPIGGSLQFIAYVKGEISEEGAAAGGQADSWHRVTIDFTVEDGDATLEVLEPGADDVDLEANLLPHSRGALPFTIACGAECADMELLVDLVPAATFMGTPPTEQLVSSVSATTDSGGNGSGTFTADPFGVRPPDEHVFQPFADEGEEAFAMGAPYATVAFVDVDDDGHLDVDTEPIFATATEGADAAIVFWLEPTSLQAVFMPEFMGLDMGWALLAEGDEPAPMAWSEGLTLIAPSDE